MSKPSKATATNLSDAEVIAVQALRREAKECDDSRLLENCRQALRGDRHAIEMVRNELELIAAG